MFSFATVGLAYDAVAATLLARAFIFASDDSLRAAGGQTVKMTTERLEDCCRQRIDLRLGLPLLVAGFCFQLITAIGTGDAPVIQCMLLAMLGVATMYYGLMRDLLAGSMASALFVEPVTVSVEPQRKALMPPHLHLVEAVGA